MSLSKYVWTPSQDRGPHTRQTPSGESLFYRSHLPYPVVSKENPLLSDQELEDVTVPANYAETRTFRLWLDTDRREYQEVLDLAANGQVVIWEKIPRFIEADTDGRPVQDMLVYVEWVRKTLMIPPSLQNLSAAR